MTRGELPPRGAKMWKVLLQLVLTAVLFAGLSISSGSSSTTKLLRAADARNWEPGQHRIVYRNFSVDAVTSSPTCAATCGYIYIKGLDGTQWRNRGRFTPNTTYYKNDIVLFMGTYMQYECLATVVSNTTDPSTDSRWAFFYQNERVQSAQAELTGPLGNVTLQSFNSTLTLKSGNGALVLEGRGGDVSITASTNATLVGVQSAIVQSINGLLLLQGGTGVRSSTSGAFSSTAETAHSIFVGSTNTGVGSSFTVTPSGITSAAASSWAASATTGGATLSTTQSPVTISSSDSSVQVLSSGAAGVSIQSVNGPVWIGATGASSGAVSISASAPSGLSLQANESSVRLTPGLTAGFFNATAGVGQLSVGGAATLVSSGGALKLLGGTSATVSTTNGPLVLQGGSTGGAVTVTGQSVSIAGTSFVTLSSSGGSVTISGTSVVLTSARKVFPNYASQTVTSSTSGSTINVSAGIRYINLNSGSTNNNGQWSMSGCTVGQELVIRNVNRYQTGSVGGATFLIRFAGTCWIAASSSITTVCTSATAVACA
jgi:hypothetical protein